MVEVGTGSSGTRFINTDYPVTDGLTAGTTTQEDHKESLEPETTNLTKRDRVGLD